MTEEELFYHALKEDFIMYSPEIQELYDNVIKQELEQGYGPNIPSKPYLHTRGVNKQTTKSISIFYYDDGKMSIYVRDIKNDSSAQFDFFEDIQVVIHMIYDKKLRNYVLQPESEQLTREILHLVRHSNSE